MFLAVYVFWGLFFFYVNNSDVIRRTSVTKANYGKKYVTCAEPHQEDCKKNFAWVPVNYESQSEPDEPGFFILHPLLITILLYLKELISLKL